MNIPAQIRAGDTVKWRDVASADIFGNPVSSTEGWALYYYLRTNTATEGATLTGAAYESGWEFTITQAVSAGFEAGQWYWQAEARKAGEHITLGAGQLNVLAGLNYTGTPGAYDGRSQAQKDLEAVQGAIRSLMAGGAVQEYRIGIRNLKRYELADLLALEGKLKADVVREQKAQMIANGLGNPHNVFVRFGGR